MSKFVIDASAWVEYFDGTELGKKVKGIVENSKNAIYTNIITVAELAKYFRKKSNDFKEVKKSILSLSLFFSPNFEFAEEAGTLCADMKKERTSIGLADVFSLLTAKKLNAKLITKDRDFIGLKEAIIIK